MTQAEFKKTLIKRIHLSKKYQEYYKHNKDEYKEILQEHFGVESSKELKIDNLKVLVDYLNFKRDNLPVRDERDARLCTPEQKNAMQTIWNSFASTPTDEALLKFVNRQTKKRYLHLYMVSKNEAQKIIHALKVMQGNIKIIK